MERIRGHREESSLHYITSGGVSGLWARGICVGRIRTFVEGGWSLWTLHGMSHGVYGGGRPKQVWCVTRLWGRVRWTSAKTPTRVLPALSIWVTMIPRYSFPAAQQAQISEQLPAHSRGL